MVLISVLALDVDCWLLMAVDLLLLLVAIQTCLRIFDINNIKICIYIIVYINIYGRQLKIAM